MNENLELVFFNVLLNPTVKGYDATAIKLLCIKCVEELRE